MTRSTPFLLLALCVIAAVSRPREYSFLPWRRSSTTSLYSPLLLLESRDFSDFLLFSTYVLAAHLRLTQTGLLDAGSTYHRSSLLQTVGPGRAGSRPPASRPAKRASALLFPVGADCSTPIAGFESLRDLTRDLYVERIQNALPVEFDALLQRLGRAGTSGVFGFIPPSWIPAWVSDRGSLKLLSLAHLLHNMVTLFTYAPMVLGTLGSKAFVSFYAFAIFCSSISSLVWKRYVPAFHD
ncbi:MAG: hypothetical protein SGCHY_001107 [Lobulomycetales sp.]